MVGKIRELLDSDRVWSAYALADLEPPFSVASEWFMDGETVFLIFRGIRPPVLFCTGPVETAENLLVNIPEDIYTYTLLKPHYDLLQHQLHIDHESEMWRMVLDNATLPGTSDPGITRLNGEDLPAILELFSDHPDRPDSFTTDQLEGGIFFGYFEGDELISVAGTHIISPEASVAAIGNVFTEPMCRDAGLATQVTGAVVAELLTQQFKTIVLNVAVDNEPAITCYRKLGFREYCRYLEGIGKFIKKKNNH
ncbi:MAG: GNAT family N-acetyltransferase [Anaerolineales bacterium]|nr:GNAT family N-acetyltransferase [Anaerolineales bacterium]